MSGWHTVAAASNMRIAIKIIVTVIIVALAVYSLAWVVVEQQAVRQFRTGSAYMNRHQVAKALVYYDSCAKISPGYYRVYYFSGLAYCTIGRYDRALAAFKHCRELTGQPYAQDSLLMSACRDSIRLWESRGRTIRKSQKAIAWGDSLYTEYFSKHIAQCRMGKLRNDYFVIKFE